MLEWNSAFYVPFYDPTSSAAASGFLESTAPVDNLAGTMKNWTLIIEVPIVAPQLSVGDQTKPPTPLTPAT
jgi:hypothetical protein